MAMFLYNEIVGKKSTDIEYGLQSVSEKPRQLKLKVRAALKASSLDYTYVVTGPHANAGTEAYLAAIPEGSDAIGTFNVAKKQF